MDHKVSTEFRHDMNNDDEIDLMELLMILVNEKKTIFATMGLVTALSFGRALLERNTSKTASVILTPKITNFKEGDYLVQNVLEKVYSRNDVRKRQDMSLDEFSEELKITGILPKSIEDKREFLSKNAETLTYNPTSYKLDLRVGSIGESTKILNDYVLELNSYYREQNESKYKFKDFDQGILADERYDYGDYLRILEIRKAALKELIAGRETSRINYVAYGFGYREIKIALDNLENIRIEELKNYLLATNIVRNKEKFESEFQNRKFILENSIKELRESANNYKELLNSYKVEENNIVVPKGVKITIGKNAKEQYYVELMTQYLKTEDAVLKLEEELKELIFIRKNLKTGTEDEKAYINESLKSIIADYNSIVELSNGLESKENSIKSGELIKVASPVEVVSNSKAKLILAVGIVMGVFLGIMAAFLKNFYKSFQNAKKNMLTIAMFLLVGFSSYSAEEVTLGFTHKEMKAGLNPDKTPFNLEKTLIKKYLVQKENLPESEIKNIVITPIFPKGSIKNVEEKLKTDESEYLFVPTEYKVALNLSDSTLEKKLKEKLTTEFPIYYIDSFLDMNQNRVDYTHNYKGYREVIKAFDNSIFNLESEIESRKKNALTKEIFYEYNNIGIELEKIKNVRYRDTTNFIKSNNLVHDLNLEKIFLSGESRYINLTLDSLMSKKKIYSKVLKDYSIGERGAQVLESGDLAMSSDSGLRERQYIDVSKEYLANLNSENSLRVKLIENERNFKEMRLPTTSEMDRIKVEFGEVGIELNSIVDRMRSIELRDYRREYLDSVKAY